MRVALDFDEVLFPFMKPFLIWLNPRLPQIGYKDPILLSEVVNYDIGSLIGIEHARGFIDEFYTSQEMQQILPERFAVAGVKSLLRHGHEVIIVTGRPQRASLHTKSQLLQHFPEIPIHYSNQYQIDKKNKAEICKQLEADILVDDQIPHINEVIQLGLRGIFVTRPWKYTVALSDKAVIAGSWHEILGAILIDAHCHT